MCGIAGFYDFSSRPAPLSAELLLAMTAALAHRGPDGEGVWMCAGDGIGLGSRRLAIIDQSAAGDQPMSNEDGAIRLVFNGEIYNHSELRAELRDLGHLFRSRSDTEVVVHAYEEWGVDCLSRFNGMWAFALWDSRRRNLFLSRDRLGIKPLYYLLRGGQIRFASEIKALLVDSEPRPELDLEALALYLTHLAAPAPHTLLRGVRKLPAGHLLLVEPGREPRVRGFWDMLDAQNPWIEEAARQKPEQLEAFAVEAIRELLSASVRRRLGSDVPTGLYLSGGVDSGTAAALMREHSSGPLSSFSVGYEEPGFPNELPLARRVAALLDCDHHEIILREQDLIDTVDDVLYQLDEPNAEWASFPLYFLSREARRFGTPVILTGEGSDEIFGGYEGYLRAIDLVKTAARGIWKLPGAGVVPHLLGPLFDVAGRLGRGRGLCDDLERIARGEPAFIGLQIGLTERLKRSVLAFGGRDAPGGMVAASAPALPHIAWALSHPSPIRGEASRYDELHWISYLELRQRLPEMLLTRLDKMTMAFGVEGRVPFLDHEVVALVQALPGSLRLRGGASKYLLKRAAEAWLPADLLYRPKQPFAVPVSRWLRGRLGHHVEMQVAQSEVVREGMLRAEPIRALVEAHRRGAVDNGQAIWSIYCLCRWYDVLLNRSQRRPGSHGFPTGAGSGVRT